MRRTPDNLAGRTTLKYAWDAFGVDPPRRHLVARVWAYAFALFLVAHGYLTFATYVTPSPAAPFEATRSWFFEPLGVSAGARSVLTVILAALEAAAFGVAALGIVGVPRLVGVWR